MMAGDTVEGPAPSGKVTHWPKDVTAWGAAEDADKDLKQSRCLTAVIQDEKGTLIWLFYLHHNGPGNTGADPPTSGMLSWVAGTSTENLRNIQDYKINLGKQTHGTSS